MDGDGLAYLRGMTTDETWDGHEWVGPTGDCRLCGCPAPTADAGDDLWAIAVAPCPGRPQPRWDPVDEDELHERLEVVWADVRNAGALIEAHEGTELRKLLVAMSEHTLELLLALDRVRGRRR